MSPSIADVLKARRGVMDHVPMGCRAAVLAALARCLKQFCDRQTWEGLWDLLGFAKTVLAAPD